MNNNVALVEVPAELDLLLGALTAKERRGEAHGFELLALQVQSVRNLPTISLRSPCNLGTISEQSR